MEELKKIALELEQVLKSYQDKKLPELLIRANELRREYATLDVRLNGVRNV